jgi:membrane peptidoglycan carboxypeptidase
MRRRRLRVALIAAALAFTGWVRLGPLPTELREARPVLDAGRLPPVLVQATLAAEDARFFSHPGVDPLALGRALWHDVRWFRMLEGGSTVTQQTAKEVLRSPTEHRTARAKLRETLYALRLEHARSKREIMALYLSVAPYGDGLTGAAAASRAYFGCAVEDLTPAQAALLAGLPQRPSALNPYRDPAAAVKRQQWVLTRMGVLGHLDAAALAAARAEPLRLRPQRP